MLYFDTEGCGYHGPTVLIQYAVDEGPTTLYNVWEEPIDDTLQLIEWMVEQEVCGFNLAFDWFHINRLYNLFRTYLTRGGRVTHYPEDHVDAIAVCDNAARDGVCLKPANALDLFLVSRKTKYQTLMDRSDIRLRRVPAALAWELARELEQRVQLDDIYFARRKDKSAPHWNVYDIPDQPDLKDVCLKFHASGALKSLAVHALGYDPNDVLEKVFVDKKVQPVECGWAPFAGANGGKPSNWKGEWPEVIRHHFIHWYYNDMARKYAEDDVKYTRHLRRHLGNPEAGDIDSILACMVGAVRWKGFSVDLAKINELKQEALTKVATAPKAPNDVRRWIEEVLTEDEKLIVGGSTKKVVLEQIAKWSLDEDAEGLNLDFSEPFVDQTAEILADTDSPLADLPDSDIGISSKPHPAAVRAKMVIDARTAQKEVELYDKILQAGRFHASFKVIGTLSSRMSGSDGLNPQGIKHDTKVREAFTLAWPGYKLGGGDFDSFEVALAIAVFGDEKLEADVKSGMKIHALFGAELFGKTYDQIMASKGTAEDLYTKGKQGVFAMIYGGDNNTLKNKLGVQIETAEQAYKNFVNKYPGVGRARAKTFEKFCSMRQPGGIGTKVIWAEPADYVESFLGSRRYFTLENNVCRELFKLANNPPKHWKDIKIKVMRRDKVQTASGAVQSALYAAAFAIQAANMRAAANHEIQSPGARITKDLQARLWTLQPAGIHNWVIIPMNIHDEIMAVHLERVSKEIQKIVGELLEYYRPSVELIEMVWGEDLSSWAAK